MPYHDFSTSEDFYFNIGKKGGGYLLLFGDGRKYVEVRLPRLFLLDVAWAICRRLWATCRRSLWGRKR